MLSQLTVRLRALLFRRTVDAELDEEMRYHLDRETERNIAAGMDADLARDTARRSMGNSAVNTEQARDAWRWQRLEELRQDFAFGVRGYRRAPLFVITVVATIGLGLGLLSAAFTLFDTYVLRPLPVRDPFALYEVAWHTRGGASRAFSWNQYRALAGRRDIFSGAAAIDNEFVRIHGAPATGQMVSGNYFEMLGVSPHLGRLIVPADAAAPGSNAVVVLSYRAWQSLFGGDSTVLGATLPLNGVPFTIVGVAAEGFGGLTQSPLDFWAPITMIGDVAGGRDPFAAVDSESVRVVARLASGVPEARARAMVDTWLENETAALPPAERSYGSVFVSRGTMVPRSAEAIELFAPIAIAFLLVLLIACANVANMMLARGMARQREIGIRLALGAGRARIVRQLFTETFLLAVVAAIAGYLISRGTIALALRAMFATVPPGFRAYLHTVPLDASERVLAFMVAAAVGVAILFGLVPAVQTTRPNIVQASRGDFDSQYRPSRLRDGLVVAQVSLSVLLLISAGVLLTASRDTAAADPGIRTANVVELNVLASRRSRVIAALRDRPDVRTVASASGGPLDGMYPSVTVIIGKRRAEPSPFVLVSPEYFTALDMSIIAGRPFSSDEAVGRAPVVIVSQSAARHFWPGQSAIGQTVELSQSAVQSGRLTPYHTAQVIGIAADAVPGLVERGTHVPVIYYPQTVDAGSGPLIVRITGDATGEVPAIEQAMTATVDSAAVIDVHTLESAHELQIYPMRVAYWIASAIGLIALGLTVTGVYGVLAYSVAQRRKEFGIRMALGGTTSVLIGVVLRHALRLSLAGILIGGVAALGLSRLIGSIIRVIDAFSFPGYAGGISLVLVTCLVASWLPARRAARANPVEALRADS